MAEPLRMEVGRVAPKAFYMGLGLALWGIVLPLLLAGILVAPPIAFGIVHCVLFGAMARRYGQRSTRGAKVTPGTLVITDTAVEHGGERLALRSELRQGAVVPGADGTLVRLDRRGRRSTPIHLRVSSEADGLAILRRLGFDAGHAAAELRIASGMMGMSVGRQMALMMPPIALMMVSAVGIAAALPHAGAPIILLMAAALFAYVFSLVFTPTKVRIGTDGLITRWLGKERFIPFTSVRAFEVYTSVIGGKTQHGVKLTLERGEEVRLPTGQTDIGVSEAQGLAARIAEAQQAGKSGHAATTTLLRGGRPAKDWLRALRAAGDQVQDLRTPAIPQEVLLRLVEDASADEAARIGAAIAATNAADPETKQRLRVAAEVSASPKLRVALDRIAEGASEDELADVLDDIDPPQIAATGR
jgi:hypothetical protein